MKRLSLMLMTTMLLISPLARATTVAEVEKNLMCTCGCTMALYTCECETADQMRAHIKTLIDQGKDTRQILNAYVARYGEKILSVPTRKGFNLLAWVMPFLALLVVGILLYGALRRWSTPQKVPHSNSSPPVESKYSQQLARELETFEEGEWS